MINKMHAKTHEIFFEHTMISFNREVEVQGKKYSEHLINTSSLPMTLPVSLTQSYCTGG